MTVASDEWRSLDPGSRARHVVSSHSEDDAHFARSIVEGFLNRERGFVELERDLVVSDVEFDAIEFAAELEFLEDIDVEAPAVQIGAEWELVPVALPLAAGAPWPGYPLAPAFAERWWRRHPLFYELADFYRRSWYREGTALQGLEAMPRKEARSTFLRRATDFLATRIAAIRDLHRGEVFTWPSSVSYLSLPQHSGGLVVSTPGCNFVVSTNSHGLRVFWSGAYRVSANYFSAPTSPASSVLQSGTYVFGVDGGAYGNQIQWDRNAVVTLPGSPSVHLNY